MILHKDKQLFRESIEAAAQHLNLRPIFVEKDYWVTYILCNLSLSAYRNTVVFKGGTSLSKAYQCIDRFSEDIDLAILSQKDYNGNQLKTLLKEISNALSAGLTILERHPAEKKLGRMRVTAFGYEKATQEDYDVVKDYVLTEINCFTDPVPFASLPISSYIAQFFQQTGRESIIAEHHLEPININVLSIERTFFEKMLSLTRLSYEGTDVLLGKIRHFYDLHQIYHFNGLTSSIINPVHYPILDHALQNDMENKVMHGAWIGQRIQDSPLFKKLDEIWQALTPTYRTELAQLIWTGKLPPPEAILAVLHAIRNFAISFDEAYPPRQLQQEFKGSIS